MVEVVAQFKTLQEAALYGQKEICLHDRVLSSSLLSTRNPQSPLAFTVRPLWVEPTSWVMGVCVQP